MTSLEFLVSKFGTVDGDRLWRLANNKADGAADYVDVRKLVTELLNLQARIKTMAEEHADELIVAHPDGRMRVEQAIPGVQWQCGPQANGFTAPQADSVTAPASGANWQDISTAPKDGTRFVAVGQNYGLDSEKQHTCIAQWLAGCWVEVSDWNGASKLKYLTHWMPLPPLPGHGLRCPADSGAAPAAGAVAHTLSDGQIEAMPVWRNFVGLWPESRREIVDAVVDLLTTPPAQAADSVLEDAARLDWLLLHISGAEFRRIGVHYSDNARRADVDAARKKGANHD